MKEIKKLIIKEIYNRRINELKNYQSLLEDLNQIFNDKEMEEIIIKYGIKIKSLEEEKEIKILLMG